MALTLATYNLLATAYIKPERYSAVPAALLEPGYRIPALVERLVQLEADVLCLQEVESSLYQAAQQRLEPLGYRGFFSKKTRGQPDGCAAFVQTATLTPLLMTQIAYADAIAPQPPSGHIAQLLFLQQGQHTLGIANTHLRWSPPETPPTQHYGYRQIQQLLQTLAAQPTHCTGWILCGDFNVTPESSVLDMLHEAGFGLSQRRADTTATCYANGHAQRLDFICYRGLLQAQPHAITPVTDDSPLPSLDQPSDHVPVLARLTWQAQAP